MKNSTISMIKILRIALFPLLLSLIASCHVEKGHDDFLTGQDDFKSATIGVLMGSTQDKYIEDNYPDANVVRFDHYPDLYLALNNKKCDIIVADFVSFQVNHSGSNKYAVLIPELYSQDIGIGFSYKNNGLKEDFNKFLAKIRSDGLYDEISKKWIDSLSTAKMPDLSSVKRSGEPIKVGCTGSSTPFDYISHGQNAGFDIELLERFAASVHRPIEYSLFNFGGLIAALSSNMVDIITAAITITPERAKKVNFADTHYSSPACAIVRKESMPKRMASMNDAANASIAVLLGSAQDIYITDKYPNAKIQRIPDNSQLILSVISGKSEVGILSEPEAQAVVSANKDIAILESGFFTTQFGVAFNKSDKYFPEQFNSFLANLKNSGEYDEIVTRWNAKREQAEIYPIVFKTDAKPIIVGTTGTSIPFSFIVEKKPQGLDIEIISRFAASIGRSVDIKILNFDALIPSLSSGKLDVAINGIMITPERANEVTFSNPYYDVETAAIALKSRIVPKLVNSAGAFRIPRGDGSDVETATAGAMTGSLGEMFMKENYPNAKVLCFDEITDAIQALRTGKVKYVMTSYTNAVNACRSDKKLVILPKHYTEEGAAVAINKKSNPVLVNGINASIKRMKEDGTVDVMVKRWIRQDGDYDDEEPVAAAGTSGIAEKYDVRGTLGRKSLRVGISASREPMCFVRNGKPAGLDCELIKNVAADLGMDVEFHDMKFSALTASLLSNKVDVVISNFTATAERAKVVDFSDTYFTNPQVLMVLTEAEAKEVDKVGFFEKIKNSFVNNLVKEKRYMLILDGLWQTVLISVFAILLGTLLGAGICFLRMSNYKAFSGFAKGYIDIMRGTPVLVLLMIVFYVVFAKSNVSATFVAVLTFALNFAAYVSEMFRSSIEGIDRGQKEAGIALGFTPGKTFRFIILPQAVARVLPVYKGEAISLVKMTSVVGYIAVQDLTKASDIIRSRTFDAFFPLIVITIIYFILAWLLGKALDLLNNKKALKQ